MKKKWMLFLLAAVMAFTAFAGSISVQAAERVVVCVDNAGGDDNPFVRIFPNNKICGTGGPFTVSMEVKVENWRRISGHANEGDVFVNALFADTSGAQKHFSGNCDWTPVSFTFGNITKVVLPGVGIADYGLIDIGAYFVKAKVSIRGFQIRNAAGKTVYSFDEDPDLAQVTDLRDIGEVNPEAMVLSTSFGESGNASFPVTVAGGNTPPEKPSKETPAEKPSKETPAEKPSKETPAEKPSRETPAEKPGEDAPVEESSTEEPSEVASVPAEEDSAVQTESVAPEAPSEEKSEPKTQIVKKLNVPFIVTLSILGVVVAAAVVVGIVYFVKKKKKTSNSENDPQ